MTTVLNININDLTNQLIQELKNKLGKTTQIEIRIDSREQENGLLSETQFWQILALLDWKQSDDTEIMAAAVASLAKMPVANIYLFKDAIEMYDVRCLMYDVKKYKLSILNLRITINFFEP